MPNVIHLQIISPVFLAHVHNNVSAFMLKIVSQFKNRTWYWNWLQFKEIQLRNKNNIN